MSANSPHWSGPGVVQELLKKMVGGLGEVLKDWEGKGLLGAPSSSVGGGGGRTVLFEAEDHGSDVPGV